MGCRMLLTGYKKCLAVFLFVLICASGLAKDDIPEPVGWVNDFAGVISPEYIDKLNSLIDSVEQKTASEIAVVTIGSIAPYDETGYARLLFDKWKPGKKGKDNGVLILQAIKERRWRIETGYGVEGILPDALCSEIGRNIMAPYFKQGQYGEGLYRGVLAVTKVLNGEALPTVKEEAGGKEAPQAVIILIVIILWIVLKVMLPFYTYGYGGYYGGGFGGGSGGGSGSFGGFGGGGGGGGGAGGGW